MIIKYGDKGIAVEEIQEFLGIKDDGIFGRDTENAVKSFQQKNNLITDGIVGPSTWDCMGLASTDLSENHTWTEKLTLIESYLPKGEYLKGPVNKDYIFLHHTAGSENPFRTVKNWGDDSRGRIATEFVIGGQSIKNKDSEYDGQVVKCMPDGAYGWHLGKNGSQKMHIESVGIELNSYGYLTKGKYKHKGRFIYKDSNKYYTWSGQEANNEQIVTLSEEFKGYKTWHKYSNNQLKSLEETLKFIGERDNIDIRKGLPELIKKDGVKAFEFNSDAYYGKIKGILSHTNTNKGKFDVFPQQELIDMLLSLK